MPIGQAEHNINGGIGEDGWVRFTFDGKNVKLITKLQRQAGFAKKIMAALQKEFGDSVKDRSTEWGMKYAALEKIAEHE